MGGVAVLSGCEKEADIHSLDAFKAEKTYIGFAPEGGTISTAVAATASWSFDAEALAQLDWLTVSPTSGSAGSSTISFTAAKNEGSSALSVELKVSVGGKTQLFTVKQAAESAEIPVSPISDVAANPDGSYRIRGTVTSIASTSYGNFYMSDDTGSIYVYGLKNASGAYPKDAEGGWESFGIEAGDIVTVQGPATLYSGTTLELVDASLISVEKSLIDVDAASFELSNAAETFSFTVTSKVPILLVAPSASWLRISDATEGNNGKLTYTVAAEANPELVNRSATIGIKGTGALKTVSVTQAAKAITEDDIKEVSVAQFLAAKESTQELYKVHGKITSITNTTSGYLYLTDGPDTAYVYGLTAAYTVTNDKSFVDLNLKEGDFTTVVGFRTSYKEAPQMGSAYHVADENEIIAKDITIKDFLAIDQADDVWYRLSGTVKSIANATEGNLYLTDGEDEVYVYGLTAYDGSKADAKTFGNLGVEVGDELTVIGKYKLYKTTTEVAPVYFVSRVPAPAQDPDTYKKVTGITSGKTYLIVAGTKAATALAANYGYLSPVTVTDEGGVIELANAAAEFIITATDGGYTIQQSNDSRYLYQTGTYNSFNVSASPTEGQVWTFEVQSDDTFKITNTNVNKYIQYSVSHDSYGSYADAQDGALLPYLYEKVEE